MASLTVKTPDGKSLSVQIPPGTDPSQYETLADDALQHYTAANAPGPIASIVGGAAKAALAPFTAPVTMLAGQSPTQLPDQNTLSNIGGLAKKAWNVSGIPERGLQGLATMGEDAVGAVRSGEPPPGGWGNSVQNAAQVVQGTQAPPKAAGFVAGMLDPRALGIGELANPVVKGVVSSIADKAAPIADWLGSRVLQFTKKMVGNQFGRGMADSASEFATQAHPEIQQAIMDATGGVAPKAAGVASDAGADAAATAEKGLSTVKTPSTTGEPHALFDYNDPITGKSSYKIYGDTEKLGYKADQSGYKTVPNVPYKTVQEKGLSVIGKTEKAAKLGHEPLDDVGGAAAGEEGPILEGEVVGGPKGAEYDEHAPVTEEAGPDEAIESLGRPTISAGASTDDMFNHVKTQLGVVGDAIGSTMDGLTNAGHLWDPKPALKQLESMYQRNNSGSVIPPWDFSPQGEYNQAVSKVINAIKAKALDDEGTIHDLSWQDANTLKGMIQQMANYTKPKFDPENMVYSSAGAAVREAIDNQAAKAMSQTGQDIQPFQVLRGAYSKLKVLEESLNNKYAGELSAKSSIPVMRTAGAGALLASGKPMAAGAMLGDYFIRKYGPQVGAQIMRAIADNSGSIGTAAGNVTRAVPPAVSAITQGLQGQ
jgi:hypothetical protein